MSVNQAQPIIPTNQAVTTSSSITGHQDDIFASPLAAETVDPSLLNVGHPQPLELSMATPIEGSNPAEQMQATLNAPTVRKHPVSFYGHPLVPAPMNNTTGVFIKDNIIYLADSEGNTTSISIPDVKLCLRFHSLIAKTKFQTDVPGINDIVKPASYRIVANYLNHDPLIFNKLAIIHDSGAVEYPTYKNGFCPYSLKFSDYPDS